MQLIYTSADAAERRVYLTLLASAGGAPQTGVTISAGDLKISKNGGSYANVTGSWTEIGAGDYYYELAAGDITTLGPVVVKYEKSGTVTYRAFAQVVNFDPLGTLSVNVSTIDGDSDSAINCKSFFNEDGYDNQYSQIGGISGFATNLPVDSATSTTFTLNPAVLGLITDEVTLKNKAFTISLCANAEAAGQGGIITAYNAATGVATIKTTDNAGGTFKHVPTAPIVVKVAFLSTVVLAPIAHEDATLPDAVSDILTDTDAIISAVATVDTVVDTLTTNLATVDTNVDTLLVNVATVDTVVDTLTTNVSTLTTNVATVDTIVDAIKVDTTQIISDVGDITAGSDPLVNAVPGSYAVGSAGYAIAAIKAKTDGLGGVLVQHVNPVMSNLDVLIVQGDDYLAADGRSLDFTARTGTWPVLTGATNIRLKLYGPSTLSVSGTAPSSSMLRFELTNTQTAALTEGTYLYEISFTNAGGSIITLVQASLYVRKQL